MLDRVAYAWGLTALLLVAIGIFALTFYFIRRKPLRCRRARRCTRHHLRRRRSCPTDGRRRLLGASGSRGSRPSCRHCSGCSPPSGCCWLWSSRVGGRVLRGRQRPDAVQGGAGTPQLPEPAAAQRQRRLPHDLRCVDAARTGGRNRRSEPWCDQDSVLQARRQHHLGHRVVLAARGAPVRAAALLPAHRRSTCATEFAGTSARSTSPTCSVPWWSAPTARGA